MPNYLHDWSKIVKNAHKKFQGLDKAIGVEDIKGFRTSDRYKEPLLKLRKQVKEGKMTKIQDILDIMNEYITDEILELYAIDKGLELLEHFDDKKDLIKTIMNRFDKDLRAINKDVLQAQGINIKVKRSSNWNNRNNESYTGGDLQPIDERKDVNLYMGADNSTKLPCWTIAIDFEFAGMNIKCGEGSEHVSFIPYSHFLENEEGLLTKRVHITVELEFDSYVDYFIENSSEIAKWAKEPDTFKKKLVDNLKAKHLRERIPNVYYRGNHPFKSEWGNSHSYYNNNWCYGELEPIINRAYQDFDMTKLATTIQRWFTNYDIAMTNPHHHIHKFYNWLPASIDNVHLLPHNEHQQSECWEGIRTASKHATCRQRDCAFIDSCVMYQNNEETTAQRNQSANPVHDRNPEVTLTGIGSRIAYARGAWSAYIGSFSNFDRATQDSIYKEFLSINKYIVDNEEDELWMDNASYDDMSGNIAHISDSFYQYETQVNLGRVAGFIEQFDWVEIYAVAMELRNLIPTDDFNRLVNPIHEPIDENVSEVTTSITSTGYINLGNNQDGSTATNNITRIEV